MTLQAATPFGQRINRAAADAEDASADLLKAVEQTVEALQSLERYAKAVSEVLASLVEVVSQVPLDSGALDPDDESTDALAKAQASIRSGYRKLSDKRAYAVKDPRLDGEKEEAVLASFDLAIVEHEHLHDLLEQLRIAILEHDADVDKHEGDVSTQFESTADLIKSLETGAAS